MPSNVLLDISRPGFTQWLETSALPGWFQNQRWFAGHSAANPPQLELNELAVGTNGLILGLVSDRSSPNELNSPYLISLIAVEPNSIEPDCPEHLIISSIPEAFSQSPCLLLDAATTAEGRSAILELALGQSPMEWSIGKVFGRIFEIKNASRDEHLWRAQSRPVTQEQSNTSLIYGDKAILKLFRRPGTPGQPNPDAEIPLALSLTTAEPITPAVIGVIQAGEDATGLMLGNICHYMKDAESGWQMALESVSDSILNSSNQFEITANETRLQSELAIRTAELHLALARIPDNEAFAPEPVRYGDINNLGKELLAWSELVFTQISKHAQNVTDTSIKSGLSRVIEQKASLLSPFHRLVELQPPAFSNGEASEPETLFFAIRHHGDYHLGQVLWSETLGWQIIDFEGEPGKPIETRRKKAIALRDVAGMVRSFDYARAVGLRHCSNASSEQRLKAAQWADQITNTYVHTYFAMVSELENEIFPLIPPKFSNRHLILNAFILEKNLYELFYELEHRPHWVNVPLDALLDRLEELAN